MIVIEMHVTLKFECIFEAPHEPLFSEKINSILILMSIEHFQISISILQYTIFVFKLMHWHLVLRYAGVNAPQYIIHHFIILKISLINSFITGCL